MKKIIQTELAPKAAGPYNQALEANDMLFVSGQIAMHPVKGTLVGKKINRQTAQVLENIKNIIEESGYKLSNVVKTTCYLLKIKDFTKMNRIYADFFPDEMPARTTVAVSSLPKKALIMVDAIAIKQG
ncbi:Rid family detoxifying hydrolase [Bacteroidota bacterium]